MKYLDVLAHDPDDPPPKSTWTDAFWHAANHFAESAMRWARVLGLLALALAFIPKAHAGGWATVSVELCKTGTPICLEEIVTDYSYHAVTVFECQLHGQQGVADWMQHHPTYHDGWTAKGIKCTDGPYTIARRA